MKLEELVNKYREDLNPTDMQIWKHISNHKEETVNSTINDLASSCNVSRTTVMRFAQKLNLEGFSELKILLKHEIKKRVKMDISLVENLPVIYNRVLDDILKKDFSQINELIFSSKQMYAYATGVMQKNILNELKRKFNNTGDYIIEIGGVGEIKNIFNHMQQDSLVIIISLSGETEESIQLVEMLKQKGISVITITEYSGNTLASISDENIYVHSRSSHLYGEHQDELYVLSVGFFIAIEVMHFQYQVYKDNRINNEEK